MKGDIAKLTIGVIEPDTTTVVPVDAVLTETKVRFDFNNTHTIDPKVTHIFTYTQFEKMMEDCDDGDTFFKDTIYFDSQTQFLCSPDEFADYLRSIRLPVFSTDKTIAILHCYWAARSNADLLTHATDSRYTAIIFIILSERAYTLSSKSHHEQLDFFGVVQQLKALTKVCPAPAGSKEHNLWEFVADTRLKNIVNGKMPLIIK